jgi:hypothetical protein
MRIASFFLAGALAVTLTNLAMAAQPADLFDFWLGDWDVSWKNADGSAGKARNRVARVLDGTVIEEVFDEDPQGAPPLLRGRSLSVLHKASGTWKQAWADNQGGFFALTGSADGARRIFATDLRTEGDQTRGQRMVFHAIEPDRFTWDWEGTTDGGRSWTLLWRLEYRRR